MSLRDRPHEYIGPPGKRCPICDHRQDHRLHQGMPRCDFCNALGIAWRYPTRRIVTAPARPGQLPNLAATTHFGDAWLACQTCHELIEPKLVWLLARRAADRYAAEKRLALEPDELYALTIQMRSLFEIFFQSRVGLPVGI